MIALRLVAALVGLALVLVTLRSAVRTFVLPRSARDHLTRWSFLAVRRVFDLRLRFAADDYATRDRVMALFAPMGVLSLVLIWGTVIAAGFAAIFWALGVPFDTAVELSGSSLLTLGFEKPHGWAAVLASFAEAGIGLTLVALLVSYLPAMYSAFARRESAVTLLEIRAGSPPTGVELLIRVHQLGGLDELESLWAEWQRWFVELEESHTSLGALIFFRSPQPQRSWVTAAGAVLDAVALTGAVLRRGPLPQERMVLRAGTFALRRIAEFFNIDFDPEPDTGGPISVRRGEFDEVYDRLTHEEIDVVSDREQAWADFVSVRAQYDEVLLALAELTMAPSAPWSSDRARRIEPGGAPSADGARVGAPHQNRRGRWGRWTRAPIAAPSVPDPTALDGGLPPGDASGHAQHAQHAGADSATGSDQAAPDR